jgi:hypothetical protein
MQDYLEFASAFEDLQDKFEELVHAYLFHEEDTKDMEDIEKAHLLESIGLKIVFRDINPEEAKEWLNHRPFEDHES